MAAVADHYAGLFSSDPALKELRVQYAIPEKSITDARQREQLGAFFFWTAWTSVTERPGQTITYTNNWPHEPLVGNTPSASLGMRSRSEARTSALQSLMRNSYAVSCMKTNKPTV